MITSHLKPAALALMISTWATLNAQVIINEISAVPNERALRVDTNGMHRLGPGTSWRDGGFSVASWSTGTAPLGHNSSGLATNLSSLMYAKTPSLYLRKDFTVTAGQATGTLALRLKIDYKDGFICYINGKEAARAHLGPPNLFTYSDGTALTAGPATPTTETYELGAVSSQPTTLIPLASEWRYFAGSYEPSGGVVEPNLPIPVPVPGSLPDQPEFSDWIELYNTGPAGVDLAGWTLTDSPSNPSKWVFPAGTIIPAGGYRIVLCDENHNLAGLLHLHANFKLSADGETLRLYQGGALQSEMNYPGFF